MVLVPCELVQNEALFPAEVRMHDMCALLSGYDENAEGVQVSPRAEHTEAHVCEALVA